MFSCNEMGTPNINFNNINLDINFDEDYYYWNTIILIRLLAWHIKLGKRKALKKELHEESMSVAWHR